MRKINLFHSVILTLVLFVWTSVWAKPRVSVSNRATPNKTETTKEEDLKALEDFGITRVTPVDPRQVPAEIYPFKQNIHLGAGIGDELSKLSKISQSFVFISYTLPRRYTPRYEINLGILGRETGFSAVRWKYEWNERNYFRPFAAAGVGLSFGNSEGLATLVQIKNYGFPVGGGFEKNFTKRQSYRAEIYSFLGFDKPFVAAAIGVTSAW